MVVSRCQVYMFIIKDMSTSRLCNTVAPIMTTMGARVWGLAVCMCVQSVHVVDDVL